MSKYKKGNKSSKPAKSAPQKSAPNPAINTDCYTLLPKAPLVLRTGRPFGSDGIGGGDTLSFPLPRTIAGALRTAWAEQQKADFDYKNQYNELLEYYVHGPLLQQLNISESHQAGQILFPRPMDILYLDDPSGKPVANRLLPKPVAANTGTDLDDLAETAEAKLLLVTLDVDEKLGINSKSKPSKQAPAFWNQETMFAWLEGKKPISDVKQHGIAALPIDQRTHVGIRHSSFGTEPGRLFQSAGVDFAPSLNHEAKDGQRWSQQQYSLLVKSDLAIKTTHRRLGGEGRLVEIANNQAAAWPKMPKELLHSIIKNQHLRLILVTPALFTAGWLPGWINQTTLIGYPPSAPELKLKLRAAALDRWLPVSGWDMRENRPNPVKRMVSAGAVYWFQLLEGGTEENLAKLWLNPLSDELQDQRDGFGLALLGVSDNLDNLGTK